MAPAGGTEDVAVSGRGGCLVLSGLPALSALCADFSGPVAGFADLSVAGLAAGFLAAGFGVASVAAGAFGSESGAASGAAAQRATAASVKQVSRTAFTDPDLSAAMRRPHSPIRAAKIEEKLRRARPAIDEFRGKTAA
jgi:hypothetical protein